MKATIQDFNDVLRNYYSLDQKDCDYQILKSDLQFCLAMLNGSFFNYKKNAYGFIY